MTSFKKNLLVLLTAMLIALAGAYLVRLNRSTIVDGITFAIPIVAMSLILEDFYRKLFTDKMKITWEYPVGALLVFAAILSFFWAAESVTNKDMLVRLGTCTFLCIMGIIWLFIPYKNSILSFEESESRRWERNKKRISKASTAEEKTSILFQTLRYRLIGDSLDGDLDFERPLAVYSEQCMTYMELLDCKEEDACPKASVVNAAGEYVWSLVAPYMGKEKREEN